ncbi:MAG: FmdB family zinc ribbon protein [Gemmatimonadota bacterium]
MPTYAYRCPVCGHEFDLWQRISDPAGAACPACGSPAERVITGGGGLLFKGGGFYLTDYRSESYKKAAKSDTGPSPEAPGGKVVEGGATTEGSASASSPPRKEKPAASDPKAKPSGKTPKAEGGEGKS